MSFVSGRGENIAGLFTTDEEDRAGDMFGRGEGRPVIPYRINNLLYSFVAPFPPTPFAVEVFAGPAVKAGGSVVGDNTVGLAWDGATKMASPKQRIPQNTPVVFRVEKIEGNKLEVWTDGLPSLASLADSNEENGLPWGFRVPVLRPLTSSSGAKTPPTSTLPTVAEPLKVPGVDLPGEGSFSPLMIAAGLGVAAVAALLLLESKKKKD